MTAFFALSMCGTVFAGWLLWTIFVRSFAFNTLLQKNLFFFYKDHNVLDDTKPNWKNDYLKVHKPEIIWIFLLKSKPYMPLVNFGKKFWFFSLDFCQNFDVRTFSRWLSIRGTKFFWWAIKKFGTQKFHFGPIRWARRFFKF